MSPETDKSGEEETMFESLRLRRLPGQMLSRQMTSKKGDRGMIEGVKRRDMFLCGVVIGMFVCAVGYVVLAKNSKENGHLAKEAVKGNDIEGSDGRNVEEDGEVLADEERNGQEKEGEPTVGNSLRMPWSAEEVASMKSANLSGDLDLSVLSAQIPLEMLGKERAKTYLVIMSSHTGSTAIMSQINRHPDVHWNLKNMEPLNNKEMSANQSAAKDFTRRFFDEGVAAGKPVGFKMNPTKILQDPEGWAQIARDYDTRVIFNYRANMFKRSVGRYSYHYLGDNSAVGGLSAKKHEDRCKMGVGCKFAVNASELHCLLARSYAVQDAMERAVTILTGNEDSVLHLPYDDYLHHPQESILQFESFLGLRPFYIEPYRAKATSDNMCEVVSNYADMCAELGACSVWGPMLEDERNNCSCSNYSFTSRGGDGVNPLCNVTSLTGRVEVCGVDPDKK